MFLNEQEAAKPSELQLPPHCFLLLPNISLAVILSFARHIVEL